MRAQLAPSAPADSAGSGSPIEMSARPVTQYWLSRYAWLCVLFTLALIFLGGMVTSKQAGMAVPDWPLSYGSINPAGWWQIENVRLEHGHRLIASTLGLLVIGLTAWTVRTEERRWVRTLAWAALAGVIFQGILGGLRVRENSLWFAVFHGCVAQAFLCLLVVLAVVLTPRWRALRDEVSSASPLLRKLAGLTVLMIFGQLIVGAVMRHFKAGLAIADFPTSMGQIVPPLQTFPVIIHFSHRVGALLICLMVLFLVVVAVTSPGVNGRLRRLVLLLGALVGLQIGLGASVIWLAKAPVPTTFHVLNGALVLATAMALRVRLGLWQLQPKSGETNYAGDPLRPLAEGVR